MFDFALLRVDVIKSINHFMNVNQIVRVHQVPRFITSKDCDKARQCHATRRAKRVAQSCHKTKVTQQSVAQQNWRLRDPHSLRCFDLTQRKWAENKRVISVFCNCHLLVFYLSSVITLLRWNFTAVSTIANRWTVL